MPNIVKDNNTVTTNGTENEGKVEKFGQAVDQRSDDHQMLEAKIDLVTRAVKVRRTLRKRERKCRDT